MSVRKPGLQTVPPGTMLQIFPSEDATVAMPGQATPQFAPLMLLLDLNPAVSAPTLTRLDAPQHLFLMPLVSELKSLMSESGKG